MITVHTEQELRRQILAWRGECQTLGFVPTMGALHEGHLSLVDRAKTLADRVVVSIFVNPSQFGPNEDLAGYPRTPDRDAELLVERGCDLIFLPTPEIVYPPDFTTWVDLDGPPAEGLEGGHRPGHFRGVATVVTILLNMVQPDVAIFGRKDAQQLAVIQRLVDDLRLPVRIVPGPTVREDDGLAMSSRNAYLSPEERRAATVLSRALGEAREAMESGERRAEEIRTRLQNVLQSEPRAEIGYAEVVDARSFRPVEEIRGPVVLPLAVRIGSTRLIDNIHFDPDPASEPETEEEV